MENTEMVWMNSLCFWYHKEYVESSEAVLVRLRLGRMQEHDTGRYSIEVNDRASPFHSRM